MENRKNALMRLLLEDIKNQRLLPGDKILSRNQLVRKYGVSYDTVDKALKSLISSGHLTARRGSGTCVAQYGKRDWRINRLYVIFHSMGYFHEHLDPILARELDNPSALIHLRDSDAELTLPALLQPGVGVVWYYPFVKRLPIMIDLRAAGVPQLLLNRDYEGFNFVTTDPDASLSEGLQWLISQRGRELSLIYGPPGIAAPYREKRIISAFKNINRIGGHLAPDNLYEVQTVNFTEEVSRIANRLFQKSSMTPGIVLLDIEMAMLLISSGLFYGKHPGRDYNLLVFDYEKQLTHFSGIGMMSQMLQSFSHEARNFFFDPELDRSKPFCKFVKTELICT